MGLIQKQIEEAFKKFKQGGLRGFCNGLADFGSVALRYNKGLIWIEIENQLKLLLGEKHNKDIIGTFKKLEVINKLK